MFEHAESCKRAEYFLDSKDRGGKIKDYWSKKGVKMSYFGHRFLVFLVEIDE